MRSLRSHGRRAICPTLGLGTTPPSQPPISLDTALDERAATNLLDNRLTMNQQSCNYISHGPVLQVSCIRYPSARLSRLRRLGQPPHRTLEVVYGLVKKMRVVLGGASACRLGACELPCPERLSHRRQDIVQRVLDALRSPSESHAHCRLGIRRY